MGDVSSSIVNSVTCDTPMYYNLVFTDELKELSELMKNLKEVEIKRYRILAPNKVIEVYFTDGSKEKLVCHDEDTFDLRKGLFLAIAKHLYKDKYTIEGIEAKAIEIGCTKKYVKMVDNIIKKHIKEEKMDEEINKVLDENKRIAHEKRMKNDAKKREHKIEIQKEAYLRAMREFQEEKALASFE